MKMVAVACLATLGFATGTQAQLLSPLRIVQWGTPVSPFQPDSVGSLFRLMSWGETYALPLPRYLEFRNDLVRITTASGSAWHLIPLSPEPSDCGGAWCGMVDQDAR